MGITENIYPDSPVWGRKVRPRERTGLLSFSRELVMCQARTHAKPTSVCRCEPVTRDGWENGVGEWGNPTGARSEVGEPRA